MAVSRIANPESRESSVLFFDLGPEFTLRERHANLFARVHLRLVANNTTSFAVPTNSIPPPEYRQRTQHFQPRGRILQCRLSAVLASFDCRAQRTVRADKPGANPAEPAPQVELIELSAKRLILPGAAIQDAPGGVPQRVRRFGRVPAPNRETCAVAGKSGTPRQLMQTGLLPRQIRTEGTMDAIAQPVDSRTEILLSRDHHLGGRRR